MRANLDAKGNLLCDLCELPHTDTKENSICCMITDKMFYIRHRIQHILELQLPLIILYKEFNIIL
jgi:hypothetical protein